MQDLLIETPYLGCSVPLLREYPSLIITGFYVSCQWVDKLHENIRSLTVAMETCWWSGERWLSKEGSKGPIETHLICWQFHKYMWVSDTFIPHYPLIPLCLLLKPFFLPLVLWCPVLGRQRVYVTEFHYGYLDEHELGANFLDCRQLINDHTTEENDNPPPGGPQSLDEGWGLWSPSHHTMQW